MSDLFRGAYADRNLEASRSSIPHLASDPDELDLQLSRRREWIQGRIKVMLTPDPVWGTCPAERVYCVGQSAWLEWQSLKPEERQRIADGK